MQTGPELLEAVMDDYPKFSPLFWFELGTAITAFLVALLFLVT